MAHEERSPQAPATAGGILRAALLGLCGGMMLGGLFMLATGLKTRIAPVDCTDLPETECAFIREESVGVGRMQTAAGAALVALGTAVVVMMRSRYRPSPP